MDTLIETALRPAVQSDEPMVYLALARIHPYAVEETILERFPARLGRSPSCEVALDDASVSREHAELAQRDGALFLRDLGSRNGSFVNRARLRTQPTPVVPGDILRLGDVVLRLVCRPKDAAPSLQASALVGGPSLHETLRLVRLLGPTSLRILVRGASGTGKELVARELHLSSGRTGAFIGVNCAAIPEPLVESELFGHVRGAFTGAVKDKPGLFEAAAGGTLFLDELTELPAAIQAKLLRVVETRELRRVGGLEAIPIDCRILSATNHDVQRDIEQGRFRGDLAARLAEADIVLPSLAERVEDIPLLIEHLAQRARCQLRLDASAVEALACYDWPLNVRELDNLVRTLSVLAPDEVVTAARLPQQILAHERAKESSLEASPSGRVLEALRRNNGNIRKTGQELGVSRTYIYRCLDRSGVELKSLRNGSR